jgi:hypothetical protein
LEYRFTLDFVSPLPPPSVLGPLTLRFFRHTDCALGLYYLCFPSFALVSKLAGIYQIITVP